MRRILLAIVGLFFAAQAAAQSGVTVISRPCPFECKDAGYSSTYCLSWRRGGTCYVKKLAKHGLRFCLNPEKGFVRMRENCLTRHGEVTVQYLDLRGNEGPIGPTGPTGPQGDAGEPGALRVYGDGSAGDREVSGALAFNDSNPQYQNFTVQAGAVLTVPTGTVIRCRGNFLNNGRIVVSPGQRNSPKFAEDGEAATAGPFASDEAPGGAGGEALTEGAARALLRPGLLTAGDGAYAAGDIGRGLGGGSFAVICQGLVSNGSTGEITAPGLTPANPANGGGGGGLVILASDSRVENLGVIQADGGAGSDFIPDTGQFGIASGGGGGGGIVHLIAPEVQQTGSISVAGGSGGIAGPVGSLTALFKLGGRGGGGSGGAGGNGGAANPGSFGDGSCTAGASGNNGRVFETAANPAAFF